jgi:hypothetical protein
MARGAPSAFRCSLPLSFDPQCCFYASLMLSGCSQLLGRGRPLEEFSLPFPTSAGPSPSLSSLASLLSLRRLLLGSPVVQSTSHTLPHSPSPSHFPPQRRNTMRSILLATSLAASLVSACGDEASFERIRIQRRAAVASSSSQAASSSRAVAATSTSAAAVVAPTRTDEASAAAVTDPAAECSYYSYPPVAALQAAGVFPSIWEIANLSCVQSPSSLRVPLPCADLSLFFPST